MKRTKRVPEEAALRRQVLCDCARAMKLPVLVLALSEILTNTLLVLTADWLGQFAEAAFALDLQLGLRNIAVLAACVLLTVLAAPLVELFGNFSMLKHALIHDRMVFDRFLSMEAEKAALRSGEVQYELEDAPNELRIQWVAAASKGLALPFCFGYLLFFALRVSPLLTLVMLLLAACRLLVPALCREKLAEYDRAQRAYFGQRRGEELDITENAWLLRLWKLKRPMLARLEELFGRYYRESGEKNDSFKTFAEQLQSFWDTFSQVLLFAAGAALVAKGVIRPGAFTAMLVYLGVAQSLLKNLGEVLQSCSLMRNAARRVAAFYRDAESEDGETCGTLQSIRCENLRFAYEGKEVFRNMRFQLFSGEKAALTGENGSGKSTLGKLLAGLLDSYGGELLINGTELRKLNPKSWRARVCYAPQTPYLFRGTVLENICLGRRVDETAVLEMLEGFGLLEQKDRLISMETDLSGGERQKISILRALVKPGQLLLLDEPTNHLDRAGIAWLEDYLQKEKRTVLLISHDGEFLARLARKSPVSPACDTSLFRTVRLTALP